MRPPGATARRAGPAGHHLLAGEDNGLNREIAVELPHMADITVECAVNGRESSGAVPVPRRFPDQPDPLMDVGQDAV